ncbi:MAG: lysine biosynthesis protein LysX [Anaerolineales bacterium]
MFRKPHLGILYSRVRVEEKKIFAELDARRVSCDRIHDQTVIFAIEDPAPWQQYDLVLIRSLSYARGLYAARILNSWGIPTVNSASVAEICGDKLATAAAFQQAGIPQLQTRTAFSVKSALQAIEEIGYPVVLKPVVGSWGRLLAKINDREAAEAILEHKATLGSYHHSIFVIQEYVEKPGRDIRAIVIGDRTIAAMYRHADHWITNTARNGKGKPCPITRELDELCVAAAQAVGSGAFGVDLIEHPDKGLILNEINHTFEFHGAQPVTGVNIPGILVEYLIQQAGSYPVRVPAPNGTVASYRAVA